MRNPALVSALRAALGPCRLLDAAELGMPGEAKEAYLFALLGYLAWHGVPGSVPSATGATGSRLLGRLSSGTGPLCLPLPARPPARLRIT